jgi:peptidoglycan/LPS O-acetylase OafA/YrhL
MMLSLVRFTDRFRRVTSTGDYFPAIDGLRFIAIFMVVCLLHVGGTYAPMMFGERVAHQGFVQTVIEEGGYGVSFFFVISGFILSVPFAKHYMYGGRAVSIKGYFLRRLTRIEPLYVVTLTGYLLLRVYFFHYHSLQEALPHYWASVFYVHNFIYHDFSLINAVTWSLEVEIQFYCLAPLLALVFKIKSSGYRRLLWGILIISGSFYSFYQYRQIGNFLNVGYSFIAGMFIADIYVSSNRTYKGRGFSFLALVALGLIIVLPTYTLHPLVCLSKTMLTIVFFIIALKNDSVNRVLSKRFISLTGGMCYSIYLIHMGVHGILRHYTGLFQVTAVDWVNGWISYLFTLVVILICSSVVFLLIEKPTMQKDWYKKWWHLIVRKPH